MAILTTGKEKIELLFKTATGYVKRLLSADYVVMNNGNTLEEEITQLNSKMLESDSVESVDFPFIAKKNGVCVCRVSPSQSTSYCYISDGNTIVGAGSCTNGAKYSFPFVVEKGKMYKVLDSSNVSTSYTRYV